MKLFIYIFLLTTSIQAIANQEAKFSYLKQTFDCQKFYGDKNHVERCLIIAKVTSDIFIQADKFVCFGEINFKQIYEGKIKTYKEGFLAVSNHAFRRNLIFELDTIVNFPKDYNALEPEFEWMQCQPIK